MKTLPIFNLAMPIDLPGVNPQILDPRDTYADPGAMADKAEDLAQRFIKTSRSTPTMSKVND